VDIQRAWQDKVAVFQTWEISFLDTRLSSYHDHSLCDVLMSIKNDVNGRPLFHYVSKNLRRKDGGGLIMCGRRYKSIVSQIVAGLHPYLCHFFDDIPETALNRWFTKYAMERHSKLVWDPENDCVITEHDAYYNQQVNPQRDDEDLVGDLLDPDEDNSSAESADSDDNTSVANDESSADGDSDVSSFRGRGRNGSNRTHSTRLVKSACSVATASSMDLRMTALEEQNKKLQQQNEALQKQNQEMMALLQRLSANPALSSVPPSSQFAALPQSGHQQAAPPAPPDGGSGSM
jgi:hypothetical protein